MAALRQYTHKIRTPFNGDKIYKDECTFSFDTPESEDGLYICMNTFVGFGKKHVQRQYEKTRNAVYLRMRRIRRSIPQPVDGPPVKKPTRLAIGGEGGFSVDTTKYTVEEINEIVLLPDWTTIPLSDEGIPADVLQSANAIIAADSATAIEERSATSAMWDGEMRVVSKHAETLLQLPTDKRIPPSGWVCEKCDKTDNLWLNLTDGSILCGRKFWDGTGGNNHAVEHYADVKYPLAVKLGTITAEGGDVFSYDEDDMVLDPKLGEHLAHFGINIAQMTKTDKSMNEMEIDLNQRVGEWSAILESGSELTPVYGAGYTGMRNLGNSCYINSVMQVLFIIPDFRAKYANNADVFFHNAPTDATQDFNVQMAKLGAALCCGEYSSPPPVIPENESHIVRDSGITPRMFKSLIGRGHPEFSTKRQQDAQEYLLHLLNMVERSSRGTDSPADAVKFKVQERIQCQASQKVMYTEREEFILSLNVPLEAATNIEKVTEYEATKSALEAEGKKVEPELLVRAEMPLAACIEAFLKQEIVDDFYSSAIKRKTSANKSTRLASFPDYLFIQMKKFTIGSDWVPKKLDVSITVPDLLDLSRLRGKGLQAEEEPLADESAEPELDMRVVAQLAEMGFPHEGCKKAVYYTRHNPLTGEAGGLEEAMGWVMEHMNDPDFATPFTQGAARQTNFTPDADSLAMLCAMGFSQEEACRALRETSNSLERAADWLFTHAGELDAEAPMAAAAGDQQPASTCRDGEGRYELVAFISHMGTSSAVGHYVCHIKKEGRWVIFNDEKVALSEKPPRELAYIYLYKRL